MLKIYAFLFFIYSTLAATAGQDLQSDLIYEINYIQSNRFSLINSDKLLKYNNPELLKLLGAYSNDTSIVVRANVQMLEYKIAITNPKDTAIRFEVVMRFLNDLKFPDDRVCMGAVNKLLKFNVSDFNSQAIDSIVNNLNDFVQCKELYLLIGKLNIRVLEDYMLSEIKFSAATRLSDFYSPNWGMQLALARMGNMESINYVVISIDSYADALTKFTLLIKDLSFTRQKEAVILLRKYLDNTNRLPSVIAGEEGAPCNTYAIIELAAMLKDFPAYSSEPGYTQSDIYKAKEWVDLQTDFTFKD